MNIHNTKVKENSNLKKVRICYRCKRKVYPSKTTEYPYQCFVHDEDLFSIETIEISKKEYIDMVMKRLHCSLKEAVTIDTEYDKYITKCMIYDYSPISMEKFSKKKLHELEVRR